MLGEGQPVSLLSHPPAVAPSGFGVTAGAERPEAQGSILRDWGSGRRPICRGEVAFYTLITSGTFSQMY